MAGMLDDRLRLFRLFSVISFVGRSFLKLFGFTSVVKRFTVCGENEEIVGGKRKLDRDEAGFVGEVESLLYLFPELGIIEQHFKQFNELNVNCCKPMGTVLMSQQEVCRFVQKFWQLIEPSTHVVVIYHEQRGSYLVTLVRESRNAVVPTRFMSIMGIDLRKSTSGMTGRHQGRRIVSNRSN